MTNLVAIPLIAWCAVPVGLVSLLVLPASTLIADLGLQLSAWFLTLALDGVSTICQWPGMAAIPCYLTLSRLILLLGGLLLIMPINIRRHHWLVRGSVLLVTLSAAWLAQPETADFQVVAISVGQGDATLLSLAGDRHYLIDGGGLPGSSIDPGEQLVAPVLGRMGIDKLQGVILTHNHPDHSSGLVYILRHFQVADLYLADEIETLSPELQEALRRQPIHVHHLKEGWTRLPVGAQQVLELFAPSQLARDLNERSIAVYASQQDQGVLLPGDLGGNGLQQLLAAGIPGRVSLLKLPHHGSRLAHPELYLERLKPALAFVSCGRDNPYGFPHQQTIEACRMRRVALLRTDQSGMLTIRDENGHWRVRTGKPL